MYSNDKKGFSLIDLLVKIIFFALFIFILIWLFNKKMPNMSAVNNSIYRENVKYMQDAGEAYFTDDKMPTVPGESYKLTLEEMENMNLIIPFVDKDGKACDKKESYVSVTKLEETDGYELKTNLVCGKESNYVVKVLGCHNYCGNPCKKKCEISKITEYEYKKAVKGTATKYSCPKGYSLKGTKCYKTKLIDSMSAIVTTTSTKTLVKPAILVPGDSKLQQLDTIKTKTKLTTVENTETLTTTVNTETLTTVVNTETLKTVVTTTPDTTREEAYACTKTKTVTECETKYRQEAYSCNCTTKFVGGVLKTSCDTCYKSVPYQSCKDVKKEYTDTCYRTVTVPGTTTYSCPSGTTNQSGSGSSLKCYKKTYSCPSGTTDQSGSGSSLKCYKKTYSCPSGTTNQSGSGANLKCYKKTYSCPSGTDVKEGSGSSLTCYKYTYSCPSGTDVKEGSGANLKCYKVISGEVSYKCESGWKLNGKQCTKTVQETSTTKECKKKGYVLEGDKCNLYQVKTAKATAKTVEVTSYKYKWSKETSLKGWERTGNTRTVDGKEICK